MSTRKYPDDFLNKIICGDCLEVMKEMPDKCVDLILTDPPYGVGFTEWDSRNIKKAFPMWLDEMIRIGNNVTFTCGWSRLADWIAIKRPNAYLYWYKPGCMGFGPFGFTHIDPMPVWGQVKMNGTHDVIRAPIIVKEKIHPTEKPLDWAMKSIQKFKDIKIILDPFLGSGTTIRAAKDLHCNFIGIEINPDYCKIAEERLAQGVL